MKAFKLLSLTATLLIGTHAAAADTCTICPQVDKLLESVQNVKPDPTTSDENLYQVQEHFSDEAYKLIHANLTEKNFTAGNAKALVKLIARAIRFENSMDLEQDHMKIFKTLYKKKNSLLKSTMDQMLKSGELSEEDHTNIMELFGIVPSQDRATVGK